MAPLRSPQLFQQFLFLAFFYMALLSSTALVSQNVQFGWAIGMGGDAWDTGHSINTDSSGNLIISGYFRDTVDFDPSSGTLTVAAQNFTDAFIQKLDPNGNLIWLSILGGDGYIFDAYSEIGIDGSVYVTGTFTGTIDFDPGPAVLNLTAAIPGEDVYIVKLDQNGGLVWAEQFGGSGDERVFGLNESQDGGVLLTGYFRNTTDFDPGPGVYSLTANFDGDAYILKLDNFGDFVWAKQIQGPGYGRGESIITDHSGNVIVTGGFSDSADFDPGPGTYFLSTSNTSDAFILKLTDSGDFIWAGNLEAGVESYGYSHAVDNSNNIFWTGYFRGTGDLDPTNGILSDTPRGKNDIFLHKLDSNGKVVWADLYGGGDWDRGLSLAYENSGTVFLAGDFTGSVDFDRGSGTFSLSSNGSSEIFLLRVNSSGDFIWAGSMGAGDEDYPRDLEVNSRDEVFLTGNFKKNVDFDPGPGEAKINSNGGFDIFVQKLLFGIALGLEVGVGDIAIYPNPAADRLTISWKSKSDPSLTLHDSFGKKFSFQYWQEGENLVVNTSQLSPGLYVLRISDGETEFVEKVLIE